MSDEEDQNDMIENNQNNVEDDSERPTEIKNNDGRYTEVDNDFLFNPIEGFSNSNNIPNNIDNIPSHESNNEEMKKENGESTTASNTSEAPKINNSPLYNTNKQIYNLKIIVLGDIAVGKTSVIGRFITNTFSEDYKSSISCEFKRKQLDIDGETSANLTIWDTCGEERFMSVTKQYYNGSHGAMIMYDLTKKDTFIKMNRWIKDVKDNAPKDIVIMVVGNKSDLVMEKADLGEELTPFKDNYLYCDVSAKTGTNVSLAFENLTLKIMENIKEKKDKGNDKIDNNIPRDSVPLKKQSISKRKKKKCNC
jgi:small GTP-binding protein